jgi:hypothetical protein
MAQARAPKARLLQDAVSPGTTVKTYFRKPVMGPGPPGIALFGAVGGMIVFGLWKVVEHNRQAKFVPSSQLQLLVADREQQKDHCMPP